MHLFTLRPCNHPVTTDTAILHQPRRKAEAPYPDSNRVRRSLSPQVVFSRNHGNSLLRVQGGRGQGVKS